LGPNAVADLTEPLKLVAKAVARQPKNRHYLGIQAHLLYRNGQFETAAERLEQLIQTDEPNSVHHPFNKIMLAMAYQSLGRADQAQKCLGEATDWIEKNGQDNLKKGAVLTEPLPWHLRLELQVLRRETQELLNKKSGASDHEPGKK
jgi:tetratricopeptide (TPR) repeat protein